MESENFIESLIKLVNDFDFAKIMPELDSVMGWIDLFVRVCVLAAPVAVLFFGLWWLLLPPKEANHDIGFRAIYGMGSIAAWQYTQRLAGLIWGGLGALLLIIMFIVVLTFIGKDLFGVLPVRLVIFVVVAVIIWFMMEKTTYGTKIRLLGTGEKVAIYSGMKTVNMYVRTHMTSSICAAIGGLLMLGTYASARADYGSQYTLQTILIIVLGGVSPVGGKGKMSGVILAIFVLKMLEAGINRFPQISSYYISLIWGGVLILAMVLDYITGDKRARG